MNIITNTLFSRKNILIASLIFLVLRLIIAFFFVEEFKSFEDYRIAQNIVEGNGYCLVPEWGATAIKAPAYPLFLSIFILLFGIYSKISIVITQHIIFSVIPFLLMKLSNEWGKYRKSEERWKNIGAISAWIFLLHPSYYYYPNVIETTNIFIPLVILFLITILSVFNSSDGQTKIGVLRQYVIIGILSGLLFLTQPVIIPALAVLLLIFLFRKNYKLSLIYLTISILIVSPWAIRNYYEFGKFIPAKSPFWYNLYNGWLPEFHGNKKFDIIPNHEKQMIETKLIAGESDVEMEKTFKDVFIRNTESHKALYIEKTFYQMFYYWYMPPSYVSDTRLTYIYARKLPVIILNALFILGMLYLFKSDRKLLLIIFFSLLYFTLIYGLTHTANIRFKLDVEWLEFFVIANFILKIIIGKHSVVLNNTN